MLYKQIREGKDRRTKFETEDKEGIWLGHNRGTNEALIGTLTLCGPGLLFPQAR